MTHTHYDPRALERRIEAETQRQAARWLRAQREALGEPADTTWLWLASLCAVGAVLLGCVVLT